MNILFFLTPKNDVAFIYSDANLREAIDLMEAAIPPCRFSQSRDGMRER
mgnify:CR=1 FL=1